MFLFPPWKKLDAQPTPIPALTLKPKAGISDFPSLFAKLDTYLFPPEQYHALLVRLIDCLPNLTSEFRAEFSDTTQSECETTALLHFMASATVTVANTGNTFRTRTVHQSLTTVVLGCSTAQWQNRFLPFAGGRVAAACSDSLWMAPIHVSRNVKNKVHLGGRDRAGS